MFFVARDKDKTLKLFNCKPYRVAKIPGELNDSWEAFIRGGYIINQNLFSDLKWEDKPIEIILVKKNNDIKTVIKNTIFNNIRSDKYDGDVWKLYDDILEICG